MATKTDKYEFRKKEDNDFYDIEDYNDNLEKIETALTEFDDSGNAEGITSLLEMLAKLVTGNKLAVTLRNLKAGLQFVLHTGAIVNNCVTNNANLPLSAAQGKVLMDMVTQLNSDLLTAQSKRYLLLSGTNQKGIKLYINTNAEGTDLCFSYNGKYFGSLSFDNVDKNYLPPNPGAYD